MIAVFHNVEDTDLRRLVLDACDLLTIKHDIVQLVPLDRRGIAVADYARLIRSADASIIDVDSMDIMAYAVEFGAVEAAFDRRWDDDGPLDFAKVPVMLFTRGTEESSGWHEGVAYYFGKYYSVISPERSTSSETARHLADWLRSSLDAAAPKLFISYRSTSRPFATKIANSLKRRGAFVWYDQWEVLPGDSISSSINRGLTWATQLILLVDETFEASRWLDMEVNAFFYRYLSGDAQYHYPSKTMARPIVPVILEGGSRSQLPLAIQQFHCVDCNTTSFREAMKMIWRAVQQ